MKVFFNGRPCRGKPGCYRGKQPSSLIYRQPPPVTRALGVIGLSGRASFVGDVLIVKDKGKTNDQYKLRTKGENEKEVYLDCGELLNGNVAGTGVMCPGS